MRIAMVLALAACGSSGDSSSRGAPLTAPDDHKLHDLSSDSADVARIAWAGKGVPLADIPFIADRIGLPMTGTADISIYLDVPKENGSRDYSKTKGKIVMSCSKCQIGDDKAKLKPPSRNSRADSFAGDGIPFGHLSIGNFQLEAVVDNGKLELTSWKWLSPDVDLQVGLTIDIAKTGAKQSQIKGCLRFKPTVELEKRDPKTHALLSLVGGSLGTDGYQSIELAGSGADMKRFGRDCTVAASK